jgi:hypothetical protein
MTPPNKPPRVSRRTGAATDAGCARRNGWGVPIVAIEHVQLAMPPGMEQAAREFYQGLLGIPEVPKPPGLAERGGAWFERGALRIHLGVDADFRPARKAHPALLVAALRTLIARLKAHGVAVIEGDSLRGICACMSPIRSGTESSSWSLGAVCAEIAAATRRADSRRRSASAGRES